MTLPIQNSSSTSNQAETHLTHEDSSGIDKNLSLEELINEYNDTESTSTQHNISTYTTEVPHDVQSTLQAEETYPLRNPPNVSFIETDTRNTDILKSYLDSECYGNRKWAHYLIFPGSTDKQTYEEMGITKYIGNNKYNERKNASNLRVYFDPNKYPVKEELKSKYEISQDASIKFRVQQQFKSSAYVRLSKDLRKASGQCGFNIIQNDNQKFLPKNTDLVVRNRFSYQRYTLYKGSKTEITGSKEY